MATPGTRLGSTLLLISMFGTPAAASEVATGVVFDDRDGDGLRGPGEQGIPDVAVSNGRDVVLTGADGSYRLPVEEGTVLFVTKPSGWSAPVAGNGLPSFYYVHEPHGTPADLDLRFAGLEPSGPLPAAVDFPLTRSPEPDTFRVIWFADPQPHTSVEVDYIRDDVVAELVGIDAAFGITAGDIMYDDLALWPRYNDIVGRIGIPWYNVPGNHDINQLSPDDRRSLETFRRTYGPPYYSFDYGKTHFVVLDDVLYKGSSAGSEDAHRRGVGTYEGRFGETQLAWLANDLAHVPGDRLVVLAMHIPLKSFLYDDRPERHVADRRNLFRILSDRDHIFSVAGHMHTAEHHYFDEEDGFTASAPLHQHVIATVSGNWWGGPFDERGIPTTLQRDGSPNGYYVMTVNGNRASMRFKAAGEPADHQLRIVLDTEFHAYRPTGQRDFRHGRLLAGPITTDQVHSTEVVVNLFDGGPNSTVVLQVDDHTPVRLRRVTQPDPFYEELWGRYSGQMKPWAGIEASSHVWKGGLPADLGPGVHTLTATATDEYGQTWVAHRVLEIMAR